MGLKDYQKKRDFEKTPEPAGLDEPSPSGRLYVIQKHEARRLHYDLRLELNGYLKSWAVPKGPSFSTRERRLAVHVEDHPVAYGTFEGIIPEGEYGGGTVMLWDQGEWEPQRDAEKDYEQGHLKVVLHGEKLKGRWALIRMEGPGNDDGKNWLLIKEKDEFATDENNGELPRTEDDRSVLTNRSMEEIRKAKDAEWRDGRMVDIQAPGRENMKDAGKNRSAPSTRIDPSMITGAKKVKLPVDFRPQLATLVDAPPEGDQWVHEIKYDGYRLLACIEGPAIRLITRRGNDWTGRFPKIADALNAFPASSAVLDGEAVVQRPDGTTDFQAMQNLLQGIESGRLIYYMFDIVYCNGYDLTAAPLIERKELLRRLTEKMDPQVLSIRYSDHVRGRGESIYRHACRLTLEGIISKHERSTYQQKRSRNWLKIKCQHRQEFVIGGYTAPSGSRTGFGALLLGYYDDQNELRFCGKVGTGFNERQLYSLKSEMEAMTIPKPPFENPPAGSSAKDVHWIRPELVAHIEFAGWTRENILRAPSFKGIREDKSAQEVRRETGLHLAAAPKLPESSAKEKPEKKSAPPSGGDRIAGVRLTHPDRVLYPEQGVTKLDLARYYEQIAEYMMPHVKGRPLTLVRCPKGRGEKCFYQKHFAEAMPEYLRGVAIAEKKGTDTYALADDAAGLISLVQMGVLEIHLWNCREDKIERPDLMIMDLDPDPGVSLDAVIEGTRMMHDQLADIGLKSFLKTSGGKGFHVVVPLVRRTGWDELKEFSRAVAQTMVRRHPEKFVATMTKSKRKGKVFIDFFRNGRGATSVAPYSTRARSGAPVSAPLRWDELTADIKPDMYRTGNLINRIASLKEDPWKDFFDVSQSITRKMKEAVGMGEARLKADG